MWNTECDIKNVPLVSILMAVYKPNEMWLREQLISINEQSYTNIELLIWDDCPKNQCDENIIKEAITNFPYTLYRGEKNNGSNYAFEELTKRGNGKYFSYCDQDDIWNTDKIQKMVEMLENTGDPLICSDANIIDSSGKKIANSITKVHKRHTFYNGDYTTQKLIISNFVMGCTTIVNAEIAKNAVPFCKLIPHDYWLGINASLHGKIKILQEPTISYRKHDNNQTGVLAGIYDKKSYNDIRLIEQLHRVEEIEQRLHGHTSVVEFLEEYKKWHMAKMRYFNKQNIKDLKIMWKYKKFGKHQVYFEIALHFMPNFLFNSVIKLLHKGIL